MTRRQKLAHIRRFKELIRVMQALTPKQRKHEFDMKNWSKITSCGTVKCAAGWAGSDPWFRKRGFRTRESVFSNTLVPTFRGLAGWVAVYRFFGYVGLEEVAEAKAVFLTPDTVQEVIRAARQRIKALEKQE